MKLHTLNYSQLIEAPVEEVWKFFSNPLNLERITPREMNFRVLSENADFRFVYPGMIIEYKVSPFKFIDLSWVTEITHVIENKLFVDEQRFGPYSFWHHQHHFEKENNGTRMTDIIHYRLPLGIIGSLANNLIVKNKLITIFNFRKNSINEIFQTL